MCEENTAYPFKKFSRGWFSDSKKLKNTIGSLTNAPQISVVILASHATQKQLDKSLNSVEQQSYNCFELIIVSKHDSKHAYGGLLQSKVEFSQYQKSIRVKNLIGDISLTTILDHLSGDFLLFLHAGDYLVEHALLEIASVISENTNVNIIYSDDDVVTDHQHVSPHFKSDWNPDLFYSNNYIGRSVVFRSGLSIADGIGSHLDPVYVCLLGSLEKAIGDSIKHIPKVLFHLCDDASDRSTHNLPLLKEFLWKANMQTAKMIKNQVCIQYFLPSPEPLVSLLIPTRDHVDILRACINSILNKTHYKSFEIIILDNQSEEAETIRYFGSLKSESKIRIISYNKPFNYSAINNYGVQHARGSILGFINNDIEVINPEWLTEMVMHAARDEIGCVGSKLYYSDGTIQHAGVILGIGGVAGHSHKHLDGNERGYFSRLVTVQNVSAVTAACMLIRKSLFDEVGGFDERHLTVAYNDVDLCLEVLSRGFRNIWTPYAELYHHESISRGRDDVKKNAKRFARERRYMKEKWGEMLARDPYYNPNLTLKKQDFSIRKPYLFLGIF